MRSPKRSIWAIGALAIAVAVLAPASASAQLELTVTPQANGTYGLDFVDRNDEEDTFVFTIVTNPANGAPDLVFADTTAGIGDPIYPPCFRVSATIIRCPPLGFNGLNVDLGGANDAFVFNVPQEERDVATFNPEQITVDVGPGDDSTSAPTVPCDVENFSVILGAGDDSSKFDCVIFGTAQRRVSSARSARSLKAAGGGGRDVLVGGHRGEVLKGGGGADRMKGGKGSDKMSGGGGPDLMFGGPGVDFMYGNGGRDFIRGGGANDHGTGGAGDDNVKD